MTPITETILNRFEEIAKPFFKGDLSIKNSKENIIIDILKDYNAHYVQGVGIIVPSVLPVKKVIVSHADLVHPFQKGFSKGEVFTIKEENGSSFLYGALDNTITNAVLINSIIELRSKGLAQDVEFLFTEGEECGFVGMRNYMQYGFNRELNPFFINLDVTNDNWNYSASIEFDRPDINLCKDIELNNPGKCGFTNFRFPDDTGAILQGGGNGFSYCIPTQNYCHTYESRTLISYLEPYYLTLNNLISNLDCSKYENNVRTLNNSVISDSFIIDSSIVDEIVEDIID